MDKKTLGTAGREVKAEGLGSTGQRIGWPV